MNSEFRLPPGVTEQQWDDLQAGEVAQALCQTLQGLRDAGNVAADTVYLEVLQPHPGGTMQGTSICIATGDELSRIETAVNEFKGRTQ